MAYFKLENKIHNLLIEKNRKFKKINPVPDFLKNNLSLSGLIKEITPARIEDGGDGAFYVYLRKKK